MARENRQNLRALADELAPRVPRLDKLDQAHLPPAYDMAPVLEPAEVKTVAPFENKTAQFSDLIGQALDTLEECMSCDDPDQDHVRLMAMRKDAALGVLGQGVKLNDSRLREKQTDMLPKILEALTREKAKLPPRVIDGEVLARS